ncbi:pre-60S ribosomal particles component [Elasticomyces elasticus]|uniref:Pre-60S ribosomal particles component n=1 Tax=Exophiala sideris TaxID=1016849 RepID=A0ABR0JN42_9EURO|nr:pre-60S ribosomal particles component [Elasticomyces elasticus]KAK5037909.1 pre-60S ribosomal particles component [Exophiala sideris]KAK5043892.1 pre-60S ribosomal particles component [Exophiala sideris]KAK5067391.1 pre-60S ribosomal particles component [Exophiala sideris]KAK5182724.1 pre-60S ribosomal particles component [Eurotiomycetes sp. CCFEE 6388]
MAKMAKTAPVSQKKRRLEDGMRGKIERPRKRTRKQADYHSSSDDTNEEDDEGFAGVDLNDSDDEVKPEPKQKERSKAAKPEKVRADIEAGKDEDHDQESEEGDDAFSDEDNEAQDTPGVSKRRSTSKRNDPEAFSTSISKILSTKLSQSARKDPVLSRSKQAVEASATLADEKLEKKAKAKLRADRREDLERGRIKDVLGLNSGNAGEIAEEEKKLRKIAQRGVVKLFNAVRVSQVKAEQAAKEERKKGTIGMSHREEKVNEMSKQGFLDLIGGKQKDKSAVAQAVST